MYLGLWVGLSEFRVMIQRKNAQGIFLYIWANKTHLDGYFHLAKTPAQSWISVQNFCDSCLVSLLFFFNYPSKNVKLDVS